MADPKALTIRALTPDQAAPRLAGVAELDPSGLAHDARQIARAGKCFAIEGEDGEAVYVVKVARGQAWIVAAQGRGQIDMTEVIDLAISEQAKRTPGTHSMGCQTARRGLVKKLTAKGWRVTGWILRKDIQ